MSNSEKLRSRYGSRFGSTSASAWIHISISMDPYQHQHGGRFRALLELSGGRVGGLLEVDSEISCLRSCNYAVVVF